MASSRSVSARRFLADGIYARSQMKRLTELVVAVGSAAVTFTLTQSRQTPVCDSPAKLPTLRVSFVDFTTRKSVADATIVHTCVGF
jgi:hypothetical protein